LARYYDGSILLQPLQIVKPGRDLITASVLDCAPYFEGIVGDPDAYTQALLDAVRHGYLWWS
jgi:hypothetical protein